MSKEEHHELIIIKRFEEEEPEHHSSAWKVAHADFMTAMMAFFLIMWLINATDEDTRKAIANYFNPVSLAESVTKKKGLNDPVPTESTGPLKKGAMEPAPKAVPGEAAGSRVEEEAGSPAEPAAAVPVSPGDDRERAAFQDPYAVLAKLAQQAAEARPTTADVTLAETSLPGVAGGEVHRDPFDPAYWQTANAEEQKTASPGDLQTAEPTPPNGTLDAASARPLPGTSQEPATPPAAVPPSAAAAESAAAAPVEQARAEALAEELSATLQREIGDESVPQLEVTETPEGLLISLTDDIDFSMFSVGSAIPHPKVVVAMEAVGSALKGRPGPIVVRGYTDGRPFRSETYDNWRLSSARAHMAYYMLNRAGLVEERFRRIESFADRDLKNPGDPNAAENRRIEILLENEAS